MSDISAHYARGDLMGRLRAALLADGFDPDRPTLEALAPYDHFHGRGLEATEELADLLTVALDDHILDIGSGIGGPARYIAERFGARITGIDLTSEFCEVARHLTEALGLADRVDFKQGDALAMPFADASFDGAYSMNVSMNIADKAGFYAEIHRVLCPGGWLVLSEIAQGPGGAPAYPTPWARTAEFELPGDAATDPRWPRGGGLHRLEPARDHRESLAYGARSRAMVERGEQPPHRAVMLIHGEIAKDAMANTARGLAEGCLVPIEVRCTKAR